MKINCNKNMLLENINIVQKAVSPKSTIPTLEGILLEASDCLKMAGNDLELGIECTMNANIEQQGSVIINSKMFGEIIRKLPEDTIHIEVNQNYETIIKCGNSQFHIMGYSATEFPEIPKVEKGISLKVNKQKLRSMIRQTIFAVGTNENKPILTGSLLEYDNGEICLVSVDGYRLALRKEKTNNTLDENFSFVIPGKTLNELSKILENDEEDISIYVTDKHALFEFNNCKIVSRLLEGEFLNYKQIIPSEHSLQVRSNVRLLIDSIERAALIVTSENKVYPIRLNIEIDKINIRCETKLGKVQDSIKVDTLGEDLEIGFNHKYLLDALKACECDEVIMELNNSLSPCIIKPIEGETFVYLVLPVRIRNE